MPAITEEALSNAQALWQYHNMSSQLSKADLILALGSSDTRVAEEASRILLKGFAPILVISGGLGKVTSTDGGGSEAARFAEIAKRAGVDSARMIIEPTATNTGENFSRTKTLLATQGIHPRTGIFVTKPYMQRRALATALIQWPEVSWTPHAPNISFEQYPDETISREQMIELMVGDLQRIAFYPELGFQAPQEIPSNVWEACEALVRLGFNRYVLKR